MMRGQQSGSVSKRRDVVAPSGPVAVLDLGSTKISCVIAEPAEKHLAGQDYRFALRVTGVGQTVSRGIKCGAIANIDEAERAIRIAVDAAERMAKQTVRTVHVNVSGGRPASVSAGAFVRVKTGVVAPRDIESAVSAAVGKAEIGKRHVLHLNPVSYSLDGVAAERPPLGMHGDVLGVEVGIVTLDGAQLRNLSLAVERSHLKVAGFGLSAYAAARGTLLADEMSLGCLLIDLGGATTSYAVMRSGNLAASGIVGLGAQHITGDLAQGLSTTIAHAERLKNMFGSVLPYAHDDREMLAVPLLGERGVDAIQQVPRQVLTGIICPRLEEIFELVRVDLGRHVMPVPVSRIVLTGGGSQLQGLREFVSHVFGCGVRIGLPVLGQGTPEAAKGGGMAVSAGLLAMALRPDRKLAMPTEARARIERQQMGYVQQLGQWLKEAI
jgi:cell division protein FtsA